MGWVLIPVVLLTVALTASCLRKARQAPASIRLRDQLLVAPRLWRAIGLLEGAAVLGLLVGLFRPLLGAAAAAGTALLMLGAILAHVRVGLGGGRLLAPAALLTAAVAASVGFVMS
jgi:hypothetical protein